MSFFTEHEEHAGEFKRHVGLKVKAAAVDKAGHVYEAVFELEDLPLLEEFLRLAERFRQPGLPGVVAAVEEEVEEIDDSDTAE